MSNFPLALLCLLATFPAGALGPCTENVTAQIRVDPGHPWRPPFELERVGAPVTAVTEISGERMPARESSLVGYLDGKEIGRYALVLSGEKSTWTGQARFGVYPTELALLAKCRFQGEPVEVARQAVQPPAIFAPFFDRGYMVTPVYWGSHWPLARGKSTGWTIDDRIHSSPSHNSVMSWGLHSRPAPIRTAHLETLDTLGQAKPMEVEQWVWLIGMTDAPDTRVLEWARSFSTPPSLEVQGARMDHDSYVPERRAVRLNVEGATVEMLVKPTVKWINPVLELTGTPGALMSVTVAGRSLGRNEYAWDGTTRWLKVDIDQPQQIRLEFGKSPR
jgi:hypothetical protein